MLAEGRHNRKLVEMKPRISVIMPVRDGARWLGEAIASVLAQTLTDLELIVIDDGSEDASAELVAASGRSDPRVRLIPQPREGLVAALNRGLDAARGTLIARLDADDRAHPQRLQRQSDYLDRHPGVGLLGTWADRIDEQGSPCGALQPPAAPEELAALLPRTNPFVHSSVMLRSQVLRHVGPYRTAFEGAEDYDLWLRVSEVAELANLPERLLQYRLHHASATKRAAARQLFSTRLAQRAAHARRHGGGDPAAHLTAPPDWRSDAGIGSPLYGDLVPLFRLLDRADCVDGADANAAAVDVSALSDSNLVLTHAERRLAQLALLTLLRGDAMPSPPGRANLLRHFIRLHPLRALQLGYKVLRSGSA